MGRSLTFIELPTALGAPPTAPRTAPRILQRSSGVQQIRTAANVTTEHVPVPRDPENTLDGISTMITRTPSKSDLHGTPIYLGGDHTASLASVNSVADAGEIGLLWFDAHPDYNTPETTPSGNPHGMVLSGLLGDGPRPDWQTDSLQETNIVLVGIRSVDSGEMRRLRQSNISVYTMEDIRQDGLPTILLEAWDVVTEETDHVHVSLDLDVFDPQIAPGVSTPVRGGLSDEEADVLSEWMRSQERGIDSLDVVELNPRMDHHQKTAELAGHVLSNLFSS